MANNFATDPSCKALWRFESGALQTDSIDGNALTPSSSPPTADTINFREGAASAFFDSASSQRFFIDDASLSAGFPTESGDTTKKISIAVRFRCTTLPTTSSYKVIVGKWLDTSSNRSWVLYVYNNGGVSQLYLVLGDTFGNYSQSILLRNNIGVNQWYDVVLSMDGVNLSYTADIYGETEVTYTNISGGLTNGLGIFNEPFEVGSDNGGENYWDGNIDELVIFNRLLSSDEKSAIINQTYVYAPAPSVINCAAGIVLGAIANLLAVPTINARSGIVLGALLSLTSPIPVPVVVSDKEIALMLGASFNLQTEVEGAIEIPCTAGLYIGASMGLASVLLKPVTIPCTAGLLLGVEAGLSGGLFIPTATPSDAPRPVSAEIPAVASLLLGCALGLASSPLLPVEIPCSPGLLLGADLGEVGEDYETWVLTGNAFSPSAYSGWNFNSYALYRGNYYAAGDEGLHLLGGEDQAGIPIHPGVRLGPINFSTDRQKRLRSMRLGATGDEVEVRVATEKDEGFFSKNGGDRVVVSRDIQGHDFTVDVQEFEELSFLEIVPLILATK